MTSWKDGTNITRNYLLTALTFGGNQSSRILFSKDPALQALIHSFKSASSVLAKDLKAAVTRQSAFVDKMNSRLWIRSPALDYTLRKARGRYEKYLQLYKFHPGTMFVPTLDIDIVWHTHQCSPASYFTSTQELAGRFLNHDDGIAKEILGNGFLDTKERWRVRFGEEYTVCGCWDCEALGAAMERIEGSTVVAATTTAGSGINEQTVKMEDVIKEVVRDVMYFRAVEFARRKKEPLPIL